MTHMELSFDIPKVSSNNYTLILCTLDNDGPAPLLYFQLISIVVGMKVGIRCSIVNHNRQE